MAEAAPPPGYQVTELNSIAETWSNAYAINDKGDVTGALADINYPQPWMGARAFVYAGATIEIGSLPGHDASSGAAINNAGTVVGTSYVDVPKYRITRGFIYDGTLSDLGNADYFVAAPGAINNAGQIVGSYHATSSSYPNRPHAFLYADRVMTDLGTLGGSYSIARDINQRGQIVGRSSIAGDAATRGFIVENGAMRAMGTLGGNSSQAESVNQRGQIVGSSTIPGDTATHAFLYADGVMTDLGNAGILANSNSLARAINDRGDVIGAYATANTGPYSFFIYSDGIVRDLDSLLDPDSGWRITDVAGINASGQIAATGFKEGLGTQAIRLNPVPEPDGWGMLGATAVLLSLRLRRPAMRRFRSLGRHGA